MNYNVRSMVSSSSSSCCCSASSLLLLRFCNVGEVCTLRHVFSVDFERLSSDLEQSHYHCENNAKIQRTVKKNYIDGRSYKHKTTVVHQRKFPVFTICHSCYNVLITSFYRNPKELTKFKLKRPLFHLATQNK
jgi:hypothetical protein